MIILKYGDAKKLESSKRWKCKCYKCGCKVILDKEDVRNYGNDHDYEGHRYTSFYWTCPYCETESYYEEYDELFFRIAEPIKDKLEEFADGHEELCVVIAVILVVALFGLIVGGFIDSYFKYNDKTYNYRIQYEDDGDSRTSWTNEYDIDGNIMTFIDEDEHIRKVQADEANIIVLKEEE